MNKKQKQHNAIIPGVMNGTKVINGGISFALQTWKQQLKTNNVIENLMERAEYKKPSISKRESLKRAIFQQQRFDIMNRDTV
jgi:ribosomal protein S21